MNDPDQIAAEALKQIKVYAGPSVDHPDNLAVIQAAIEKATEQIRQQMDFMAKDLAQSREENNNAWDAYNDALSRAAHASSDFTLGTNKENNT